MVKICECCGHPLPEYDVLLDMTPKQQQMFAVLHKAGRAGITSERIKQRIYGADPNGGPSSRGILTVMKNKMQHPLQKHGMKISVPRGPNALWRLEKI